MFPVVGSGQDFLLCSSRLQVEKLAAAALSVASTEYIVAYGEETFLFLVRHPPSGCTSVTVLFGNGRL